MASRTFHGSMSHAGRGGRGRPAIIASAAKNDAVASPEELLRTEVVRNWDVKPVRR